VAVRKGTKTRVPVKTASAKGRKRKSSSGKKKISWGAIIWLGFIILMLGLYLFNREAINNSIRIIQKEVFSRNVPEEPITEAPVEPAVIQVPSPAQGAGAPPATAATPPPPVEPPSSEVAASQPPATAPSTTPATAPAQTEPQNAQSQTGQGTEAAQGAAELRDRALYFIRIGSDGSALRVRADRRLPVTDSPLRDAIQALIAGPNAEERQRGLISLIPGGTRLLSITIRGDTAYINFSEDFQYNTYGSEGHAAQLRQVVFTATEFPNIRDVQILIEGSRVDFLGENIWIGSPLSQGMLQ